MGRRKKKMQLCSTLLIFDGGYEVRFTRGRLKIRYVVTRTALASFGDNYMFVFILFIFG